MKFKSRPTEIDAFYFEEGGANDVVLWARASVDGPLREAQLWATSFVDTIRMRTSNGNKPEVGPGTWIIREPTDSSLFYPCDAETFERRWNAVPESQRVSYVVNLGTRADAERIGFVELDNEVMEKVDPADFIIAPALYRSNDDPWRVRYFTLIKRTTVNTEAFNG
jgi:hypothetical protein